MDNDQNIPTEAPGIEGKIHFAQGILRKNYNLIQSWGTQVFFDKNILVALQLGKIKTIYNFRKVFRFIN